MTSDSKCPICGKPLSSAPAPAPPFCSRRCQLVDLSRWLGEDYRISEDLRPDHFLEMEEMEERSGHPRPGDGED